MNEQHNSNDHQNACEGHHFHHSCLQYWLFTDFANNIKVQCAMKIHNTYELVQIKLIHHLHHRHAFLCNLLTEMMRPRFEDPIDSVEERTF